VRRLGRDFSGVPSIVGPVGVPPLLDKPFNFRFSFGKELERGFRQAF
jgi:hypothetical protein